MAADDAWPAASCARSTPAAATPMSGSGWCARAEPARILPTMARMSTHPAPLSHRLQRLFLTGLLTLLPLWLTWVVVKFVFGLLSDISRPLVEPSLKTI